MATITKLELTQRLAAVNAELEAARLRISVLMAENEALRNRMAAAAVPDAKINRRPYVGPRATYEFNPAIPGDFRRAQELARANGGIVKRMQA